MKKKIVLFMTIAVVMLTGCGAGEAIEVSEMETASNAAEETALQEIDAGSKDGSVAGYGIREPEEDRYRYTWQEMTITLPQDWAGHCVMEESETGFSIYQKASYEKDDTLGYICGFFRTEEPVEYDHGKIIVAYTEDGKLYYMAEPTDVSCDMEDEKIVGEYIRMCGQTQQLKASLQISAAGAHCNADEYILPTSSILPLDQAAFADFSDNTLWIAKNEIYARHGRQFMNEYLQQYFNRCTWYEGVIPPEEFRESVLNQTEKENLQMLAAAMEEYDRQHPYPKMYQASETASEDLDGDGRTEKISYKVEEQENGEVLAMLTVNGETYIAGGLSDSVSESAMTNPTLDCFYITDIKEDDGTLEIAVLDEGPSDDPVTYFFQYDGTLSCIGLVPGFPFAELNGGFNGFNGYGGIIGRSWTDLIETAYLQDYWWYDGSGVVGWDLGWCDFWPSFGHTLYEDLPVYCEQDETSANAVIPAQEEVFFLGTDRERWILVKGKDGSQGYMLVEDGNIAGLNKPAGEVFSGLQFSG